MKKDEKIDNEQLKKDIDAIIPPGIKKIDSHPLVKKYGVFTGALLGLIVVVLLFNNSMIGIGGVETKDNHVNLLDGIGSGVETKSSQGSMNEGVGADKVNTKDASVSKEDAYIMQGQITTGVFNISSPVSADSNHQTSQSGAGYTAVYTGGDLNSAVSGTLGIFMDATTSWISLIVMLAIVGFALAIIMGVLFKISRIMGLG